MGYIRASKKDDIILKGDVWSVLDTLQLINGRDKIEKKFGNFKKFQDGHAVFLTPAQMEGLLGSLIFVLFFLGVKVKAKGGSRRVSTVTTAMGPRR